MLSEVETPGLLGQVAAEGEGAQGRWQAGIDALSAKQKIQPNGYAAREAPANTPVTKALGICR